MNFQGQCTYRCGQNTCTLPGCPPIHTVWNDNVLGSGGSTNMQGPSGSPTTYFNWQTSTTVYVPHQAAISTRDVSWVVCTMGGPQPVLPVPTPAPGPTHTIGWAHTGAWADNALVNNSCNLHNYANCLNPFYSANGQIGLSKSI